ncbi:MAG TPA: mannosyl-3-phosphoglycerate phosphatase, partial [Candidatus Deferrimicrobiaceae bacterium]|nr:mannosyl-3-phosphoglycerate phosphatase [Candidatus Deferrimicrobiaceae bacterium]
MKPKIVVFADLDGTILDEHYNFSHTQPIIHQLLTLDASIVLASSKTRSEVEFYRRQLGIKDPFIVENGSAIFIPKRYFKTAFTYTKQHRQYHVIELGMPYSEIRVKIKSIKKETGASIIGFGDMTLQEVAKDTGLPVEQAQLAKAREYDEPFRIIGGSENEVIDAIEHEGLCYTKGGRYFHVLGNTDKGKATVALKQLYQLEFQRAVTIGIGDSPNDFSMFAQVDKSFIIAADKSASPCWQEILKLTRALLR